MKIYKEDKETIFLSQFKDPLMDHLYKKILFHLKDAPGKKLLDVGCGAGKVISLAGKDGFEVLGVEIEEKVAGLAQKNLQKERVKGKIITGDILKTKLKKEQFDVVVCSEVIEHVDSPEKIIQEIHRLLKKDGILILTTPHNQRYWTVSDEFAEHKRRFSIKQIKKILANFEIKKIYTVGFPGMASLILIYNFLVKLLRIQHNASWRRQQFKQWPFYLVSTILLRIDDIFNGLNFGIDIVAVAKKR